MTDEIIMFPATAEALIEMTDAALFNACNFDIDDFERAKLLRETLRANL